MTIAPSIGSGAMRILAMLGVMVCLTAAGWSMARAAETAGGNAIHQQSPTFDRRCAPWDEAAGRVISQLRAGDA